MKNYQLATILGLAGTIALFAVTPSDATEDQSTAQPLAQVSSLADLKGSSTSAADLLAQTDQAAVAQVTGVQINQTDAGIEVILETSEDVVLQSETRIEANTFIAEIPNAVLTLPDGKEFQATNPATGIQSVMVTQGENNRLEVRVIGETVVPVVDLQSQLSPTAIESEENEVEVLVIGDRLTSYRAPNASTATGTDTPILETPVSIQVVPQEVIRDQQITQLEEALRNTSGVTFQGEVAGRGGEFSIRGFENAPILRDGFREYGTFQSDPEVANLERIEVLKGPASILYGEIQPGGVINLVSKKPLSEPFYEAEIQVGSREFFRPRIDLSGPLTGDGRLLYRLNALAQSDDGFRDYDQNIQRAFVAPTLAWKISDNTDLSVSLEYLDEDRPADFGISAVGNEIADVPRDRIVSEPDDTIATEYLNVGYNFEHRFSQNWKIRNAFRYSSYDYDYGVIALPLSIDTTGTVNRFFGSQEGENESYTLQTNLVGQFATGSITHTLLFGVDLNHSDNKEFSVIDLSTPTSLNIFDPDYGQIAKPDEATLPDFGGRNFSVNRLGVYVQDQISFLENLQLLLGIRYDTIEQKTEALPGIGVPPSETNQNDDAFIPRVGILYQPSQEVSLYGSYSRSFNANLALTTTAIGEPLEPERGEGWEVGVKTELFQNRLLATLAYFDITKQNVAVTDPDFPLASVTSGEQHSRGVELDVAGEILPGWKIIASYAYINAEVTEDPSPEENTIGNRLFGIPEHSASLWTTYEIQQGNLQGLGFGVGVNYVGERQGDLLNSYQVDSYFIANAAIFYRRNNWRLGVNFKNLGDVNYIESVQNVRASRNYFGEPFTVIASFSVQF